MKSRIWMAGMGVCLALVGAWPASATTYYVNDNSPTNDVYTSGLGNDVNPGTNSALPKLTLASVLTNAMAPGDIVYIDTGTYTNSVVIGTNVNGAAGNRILFQGSTSVVGRTIFTNSSGNLLTIRGSNLHFRSIQTVGGIRGFSIEGSAFGLYEGVLASGASANPFYVSNSRSNVFRRCVAATPAVAAGFNFVSGAGNYLENCVAYLPQGEGMAAPAGTLSNMVGNVFVGRWAGDFGLGTADAGTRNVFSGTESAHYSLGTLADLQRQNTNWYGNAAADPKFVNADALDFHLLSAAGNATNGGGWATNAAAGYSPAIDFGARSASVGDEPEPNGGRVNVGLYGGTAEASKSNTNDWLFAMSFNDGGTLMQTGRLEWAASTNFGAAGTVDLQYTTNNWATTNAIATVAATNESYVWAPAFSYPAVLWRVVGSANPAAASTNAKPFSIRRTTNTTFVFYVNDASTAGDVYGMGLGSAANDGASANWPKDSLQAIVSAYQLRGGDAVYIDTGTFSGQTTAIGGFDSGSAGLPVRIVGSTNGTTFSRGNTSADVLDITGASYLEIENLRLTGGRYGLNGGVNGVTLRNVWFTGNLNGALVTGAGHVFENCVAADNATAAFVGGGSGLNQWKNGVLWNSPTIITASSNKSLSVSNSILGRDAPGATLFSSQVVPGDYNLVWNATPGSYATFTMLQDAGLGWSNSVFADPLFANSSNGDYHLKSLMGRYDTNTSAFATNDAVHSPAIDLGNPAASVGSEEAPNGGRLNAGRYGGTAQASKSRTNAWIQLANFMDGGTLDAQAGAWVRWNAGAYEPGATITIWISRNGGTGWEVLATNVPAADGRFYFIDPTADNTSSRLGMLRVELDGASPAAWSQSATNFTYRNGTFSFYVNDDYSTNDVYCTASGSDANSGASPEDPMRNLHALLDKLTQLGAGDRIFVDTGVYTATNTVKLTSAFSGSPTNFVVIAGSTNRRAGGSLFRSAGLARPLGFDFQTGSSNIMLRDVVLTNVARGVAMTNAVNVVLDGVEVRNASSRAFDLQGNARSNQLVRCVAQRGSTGVYLNQASNIAIRNCVFWENTANALSLGSSVKLVLQNSILASTVTNAALVALTTTNGFASDYNGMHAGSFTRVGSLAGAPADNLAAWIRLTGGQDVHSVPGDPQMANPDPATNAFEFSFDYHLKTEQTLGRYQPDGQRTSDTISSPLLDAGNPVSAEWTNEPAPNGSRINVGRFGGTEEASIAPDYLWIKTVSFGDAGGATNGTLPLVWTASGLFTTETVRVEISVDGGKTWSYAAATGVPATNGQANWTVTGLPDTPAAAWRVVCEGNTNLWAQTTNFFAIRNTNLNVYIGTVDTNDNVYAEGIGLADNWTATSAAPLNSLRLAFERFDLEPGDRIWVDTGTYEESSPILIGLKDTGTSNTPIRVTGNPDGPYAQTILKRTSRTIGAYGIQLSYANGIQFESLAVSNAYIGIRAENSQAISLNRLRVASCFTNAIFAGANTRVDLARSIVDQCLSVGIQTFTGAVVKVENCLIRNNALAGVLLRGGDVEIKNSILEAVGSQAKVYHWSGGGQMVSDYNNIRVADGANVAGGDARAPDRFLIDWQASTSFSNDVNSFGYEARFANEAALDFHLKSQYGRFDPALEVFVTNDVETSRLIDLGAPVPGAYSAYSNEPAPNGNRINVGLYGNTAEASKSPPPGTGVLIPLTMSDGGTVRDTVQLYWSWNGFSGAEYVNLLFSADGGSNWTNIATHIYINLGTSSGQTWATTNFPSTAMGVWRVALESDTNIYGQTETLFAVKNDPVSYYVNDVDTNYDVYCTAAGSPTNTGVSKDSPLDSLETLLNRLKVEHGDTIYVDTGIYSRSTPLVFAVPSASATNWLVIQGSTNEVEGGTVFTNSGSSGAVLDLQSVRMLDLRDLRLHGGRQGLLLTQSSSNLITRVRAVGNQWNAFELGVKSDQNRFIQCAALNFARTGLHVVAASDSTTNFWGSGVIVSVPASSNGVASSTGALLGVQSGRIYVSNSVFVSRSPGHVVFSADPASFYGDYNVYHQSISNSLFSRRIENRAYGVTETSLGDFGAWKAWVQCDSNSLAADPLFADLDRGDLHPRSAGGRYVPADGAFVEDDETSPLVDTADPALAWTNESAPNGKRANVGIYGGTEFASRTSTNTGSFILRTFNQGGIASGVQTLRWIPQGEVFTTAVYTVYIKISTNSGNSYQTIGTNQALAGSFVWDTTACPSLPTIRWQVQCQQNLAWTNASQRDFAVRNTNLIYYVNDASSSNDVYTSALGSSTNSGLRADSPISSLAALLARYDMEPGDTVLIDTGIYNPGASVAMDYPDSGTESEPVTIQGSTNQDGTLFTGTGLRLANVRGVRVRNLRFASQTVPPVISTRSSENIQLEQVDVFDSSGTGVAIVGSSNVWLRNFLVARAVTNGVDSADSYNSRLEFGTICSNGNAQVSANSTTPGSFVTVSNCALGVSVSRKSIYYVRGEFYADRNCLYLAPGSGALAALQPETAGFVREFDSVGSWAAWTGQDRASLSVDPLFADGAAGDFHLKSSAGRFNPATGTFVADLLGADSPLIDAGDPSIACSEPDPNGSRVNIGRYANTAEASMTPAEPALALISFNDGGRATGTNVLITWNARNAAPGATLTISYSSDGGSNWTVLATNVSVAAGSWIWDTTASEQSVQAKLKIEIEPVGTGGAVAQSAGLFSVRNSPFSFYINDNSSARDVYCSGVGNDANSGLTNSKPMADFNALLSKYDLEGGDVVYIDTGVYRGLNPWRITQSDTAGSLATNPVIFQGSTNSLLNGTVLDRGGNLIGIQADYAVGFRLRNIVVSNTVGTAVVFNDCYGGEAEWVAVGAIDGSGFRLNGGTQLRLNRCAVLGGSQGIIVGSRNEALTDAVAPVIDHCAIWGTQGYAFQMGGNHATIRHSILSVAPGWYIFDLGAQDELDSDYNAIWLEDGARVLRQARAETSFPLVYETVGAWAAASGKDLHSFSGNPQLADPAAGDFHPLSRSGRWNPAISNWVADEISSPLIDAGDPATSWTNEPLPNGTRPNIGLYGGTEWASKSGTNSALYLLSLNRGGVASGQVALNWMAAGMATGHTVRLEVSIDAGTTWTLVKDGVAASLGGVTWNSQSLPSSPLALWRVLDEVEPGVGATSEQFFVLHNGPVHYYVNDDSSADDVYCGGALGNSTNSGAAADSPKRWISEIVETYNLEPGDVIHVDTGYYNSPAATTFGDLDAGDLAQESSRQVNVEGSTNGSIYVVIDQSANGFQVNNTYGIRFSRMGVLGASNGLSISGSEFIAGDWLNIRDCYNGVSSGGGSSNLSLSHSAVAGNRNAGVAISGTGSKKNYVDMGACLLWSNRFGVYLDAAYVGISNSIIGMKSPDSFGYYVVENAPYGLQSDYNNLYVGNAGAAVAARQVGSGSGARTSVYNSVSSWAQASDQDRHSLPHDPLLVDPDNEDYHLKSAGGRYKPGTGWVIDVGSSPLIDSGAPHPSAWSAEPNPNGRRLNIGLFGGTAEASKTPLSGWLTLITLNDGGTASGTFPLQWTVGGAATNYTLCIDFSPDNGVTWTNLVCGWPAALGSYMWDSVPFGRTALGRWRAWCVEDDTIGAVSFAPFRMPNEGWIPYYVNDSSTNGDVFCSAPGDDANNGLTTNTPKASLQAILDTYDLDPSDIVYVDAGNYSVGSPIKIDQTDSGWSNLYVTVQGSTNPTASTVFSAISFSLSSVFSLEYAANVRVKDLTLRNATVGVSLSRSVGCELDGLRVENNRAGGLSASDSDGTRLIRSVLWRNSTATGGVAVALSQSQISIINSVLWGSPVAISLGSGGMSVTNSVLDATGANGMVYQFSPLSSPSTFQGDYNCYIRRDDALFGRKSKIIGSDDIYNDLPGWSAVALADRHSMTIDPAFANTTNGDFHAKSTGGRFTVGGWTNDATLSPLVDAGSPASTYANEPAPNGGYVNLGAYGNTQQASMTQTNPPWLRAVSFNDEGVMTTDVLLYWLHGGMPSNTLVRLDYSTDAMLSWKNIVSNLAAGTREYVWDVRSLPLSLALNWRVVVQGNTNIWDASDVPVRVKPGVYDYFVNDGGPTNVDVFCAGPGLSVTGGANPTNRAFPINSLSALLANYPVSAGDRVYVDTGTYPMTGALRVVLDSRNMGTATNPLRIYGSTNASAGGTLLLGDGTGNGIEIKNTSNIELYDLRIASAGNGVAVQNSSGVALERMELFNNATNGALSSGSSVTLRYGRLWGNRQFGYFDAANRGSAILNSTLWGNRLGAVWLDKELVLSNSILCVTNAAPIFYENGNAASVAGDYNLYGLASAHLISSNIGERVNYAYLSQWQAKGRDAHSMVIDPMFVNPSAGNFHVQSRAGYWSNNVLAVFANTSWAIDGGDPASTNYAAEPPPNGGRLNLGAYGGTTNASRSDTNNPALLAISFRDGGTFSGGEPLSWAYRGILPTNTVRIDYSTDGGLTWSNAASQIRIDSSPYLWYPPSDAVASPEAWWRVVLDSNTNVWDSNRTNFTFRPVPLRYYVNDTNREEDVYTEAIGSPTNRGYVSNSPLHSIQAVLDRYQLAPGDEIWVDTGVYVQTNSVFISVLHSGSSANRVKIIGSTNWEAGGSWLQPDAGMVSPAFQLFGTHDIQISNFRLTGFPNGISISDSSARCLLSDLDIRGSTGAGVMISQGNDVRMERVLIREGGAAGLSSGASQFSMNGCVVWSNRSSAILMGSSSAQITNSVIEASGEGWYCYQMGSNDAVNADYNDLYIRNGAQIASVQGLAYEKLPQWVRGSAQDRHSLSTDPLFYDPAAGDFHLMSSTGRYQIGTGWVQDVYAGAHTSDVISVLIDTPLVFSPLIDMGAPQMAWSNEPAPNGSRCNIGLYGNTAQASKSNPGQWLEVGTAMSGGLVYGSFYLTWGCGAGIASNAPVQLEYSRDNGMNWLRIDAAVAGAREYYWHSDQKVSGGGERWPTSPGARWRIFLLGNTNVWDMTDLHFGLRNSPFKYYLNDDSREHDVYTTEPGNDDSLGFVESSPKLTLTNLLTEVDLEPTDILYVDTGIYPVSPTNLLFWSKSDGGAPGQPIQCIGSTDSNGSWIVSDAPPLKGQVEIEAPYVNMQNLNFSSESLAFTGGGTVASNLWVTNGAVDISGGNSVFSYSRLDRGLLSMTGESNVVDHVVQRWGGTTLVGTNVTMRHTVVYATNNLQTALVVNAVGSVVSNCTVVASRGTAINKLGSGTLRMGHNILVAGGTDANSVINWQDGTLISDWNDLTARDSAWIGSRNGKWEKLAYWQIASGLDANSVSFDTADSFQNEAEGDFHLNSTRGRWSPLLNRWDTDTVHSVLIDLGDPSIGTGFEPSPNGYRPNLGSDGRDYQASKSSTNMWVTALSHNDGGVLKGTNVVLRWACPASGFSASFRLEYSSDGGGTWTTIVTGQGASQGTGTYTWDTSGFEDSFNGLWRVVAEDDSAMDQTDAPFALRNQVHAFYVNDADSADDIYCSGIGSAVNSGLSNSAPKLSLQQILDTYDLESGDVVYLDTGSYNTNADTRIIWSRGGDTNGDVVIQGNTNSPFATVLRRTGSGSTIGIDVKASYVQLRDMNVRGTDRAIRLESNRNVTVYGVVLSEAATGLDVRSSQGTEVRNSAFWKNAVGVNLVNTRTSVLENLTFALSTLAGIQMQNTTVDTLQNNIFIPDAGAYAYSIGDSVSLLSGATMDYNLYDFGNPGSGFYLGATNYYSGPTNDPLRRWQVGKPQPNGFPGMYKDFRSAITNANLVEINYEPLDFHHMSVNGRWVANATGGEWTIGDVATSWAIDHGNPEQDYANETPDNGDRLDIGMYGNTIQASKGSTNVYLEVRTMNFASNRVSQFDPTWPLIWSEHMVDPDEWVWVQFSGDGGSSWITLATVKANVEYYVWPVTIDYSTAEGYWRVVSTTDPSLIDPIEEPFVVQFRDLGILTSPRPTSGLMRFDWEGGLQGRRYEIRYSDDFGKTWLLWDPKYNGPATINKSNFVIPVGGSKLSYTFEDRTSYLRRTRWYRIFQFDQ